MAIGVARVFTSCWRHARDRLVRWTSFMGGKEEWDLQRTVGSEGARKADTLSFISLGGPLGLC